MVVTGCVEETSEAAFWGCHAKVVPAKAWRLTQTSLALPKKSVALEGLFAIAPVSRRAWPFSRSLGLWNLCCSIGLEGAALLSVKCGLVQQGMPPPHVIDVGQLVLGEVLVAVELSMTRPRDG